MLKVVNRLHFFWLLARQLPILHLLFTKHSLAGGTRNMIFLHHSPCTQVLTKISMNLTFSSLSLIALLSFRFKFPFGHCHIDNTLASQLNHLPPIPAKPAFLLSHILTRGTISLLVAKEHSFYPYFHHFICSYIMPP